MILPSTGITTYTVRNALGTSSTDIGTLCSHPNINQWSKWKPVALNKATINLNDLKFRNYGIQLIDEHNIQEFIRKINANNGAGYTYLKPSGGHLAPYRLGDFRNYDQDAQLPIYVTYRMPKEQVNIKGVTANNHIYYEKDIAGIIISSSDTQIGIEDIYPINYNRGVVVTDGSHNVIWTDKYYWWDPKVAEYFSGKQVSCFEFFTNLSLNPNTYYMPSNTDRFIALPYPKSNVTISDSSPVNMKKIHHVLNAHYFDATYYKVQYELQFDAIGEVYRGGTINDVHVLLSKDTNGFDIIDDKLVASSITVKKGQRSIKYNDNLYNDTHQMNIYILVKYDNKIQAAQSIKATNPDLPPLNPDLPPIIQ